MLVKGAPNVAFLLHISQDETEYDEMRWKEMKISVWFEIKAVGKTIDWQG